MSETKIKKAHVKKPPHVRKAKPVQNRCGICEHPCTPEKKAHDGCVRRQLHRAKISSLKVKQGRKEIVSEEAQVRAEEAKQAKAKADAIQDSAVVGKEGN